MDISVVRLKLISSLSKTVTLLTISAILLGCGQTPLLAPVSATPAPPVVTKTVAVPVVAEKAPSVPDEPPPPQVCDLQNPTLFSILIYDNDPQKVLSRYLPQAVSYEVTYKNPITGQVFRMTGTGLDAGVTMAYLSSLRVCFEAIETTKGFETDPWDALGLDQILFEEVGKATSRQPDELAQYNTLADAITSKGGDVVKVRTDAIQRAGEAVNQASADAKLTDQQAKEIAAALEPAELIAYHRLAVEIGLDVLNPIQPQSMDPAQVAAAFGDKLCFWGSIDEQYTLPFGTPAEVEAEVRTRLQTMGKNGGLILGPTHHVQLDTPMENFWAMVHSIRILNAEC